MQIEQTPYQQLKASSTHTITIKTEQFLQNVMRA